MASDAARPPNKTYLQVKEDAIEGCLRVPCPHVKNILEGSKNEKIPCVLCVHWGRIKKLLTTK